MKVFLVGSTGILGRRLIPRLVERGHEVVALTRRHDQDAVVANLGAKPARASLFDPEALRQAARRADVLVHAATAIPRRRRASARDWEDNDRLRREGTHTLVALAKQVGAQRVVLQSVAWLARPDGDAPFNEYARPNPDATTLSMAEAEETLARGAKEHGFEPTVLRCGWFYAPDSFHTRMMGEMLARRRMPIVGRGDARWSMLHVDDAASAFAEAVDAGATGTFHVVDEEPVMAADFLTTFAEQLEAPPPRRVPAWLARLVAGRLATEFITRSTQTDAGRFRAATGWEPRYATYREGLESVVAAWRREGWSPAAGGAAQR